MAVVFKEVSYNNLNISLEIKEGIITGIIGSTGSGKSDIADIFSGLCTLDFGEIVCENASVVYQNKVDEFYFDIVGDNFNFLCKMNNISKSRINKSLKMVELGTDILDKCYYNLSLSEVKKVSLALSLLVNPKIIVLDDLFFGLNGKDRKLIVNILRKMKIRYGRTIIILSRDSDLIHSICDEVILLCDGKVIKTGDKYDVFTDYKALKKAKISVPKIIEFSNLMSKKLNKKVIFRDDINDLAKDVYRLLR